MEFNYQRHIGGISLKKLVSINDIEQAYNQLLHSINRIEQTISSQTEIEINEMKIAQQEKIVYLQSCLSEVDRTLTLSPRPTFRLVMDS